MDTGVGTLKAFQSKAVTLTGTGDIVPAQGTGRRIKVYRFSIQSRTDGMTVQITDGQGGTNLDQVWTLNAREGTAPPSSEPPTFLFATSGGNALSATVTGAGTVDIAASFWVEP